MFFTFKWMDNLQQIEHHQKIKNCLLFFIFNFRCCKFFALKENHYSKQTNHLHSGFSSWGDQDVPLNEGTGEGGGGSPCKPKSLNFFLLLDKNVTYWEIPHIGKKGISNSFQINLTKILPAAYIQLNYHDLFEKAQLKLSPLIQKIVKFRFAQKTF